MPVLHLFSVPVENGSIVILPRSEARTNYNGMKMFNGVFGHFNLSLTEKDE